MTDDDPGARSQPAFGTRLRALRRERGLSQAALAAAGLSTSYVSLLESGRREPTRRTALALASFLDVEVGFLLFGRSSAKQEQRELDLRFAELALRNGDGREARRKLEALRQDAPPGEPTEAVSRLLAQALEHCGELESAIELLEELRERAESDPGRWPWMHIVIDLSRCYREAGDLTRAVEVAERAVERARSLGMEEGRDFPRLVVTLAGASRERGDHAHASQLLARLMSSLPVTATRRDRGSALWNAAVVAAEKGLYADGVLLADRAIAQFAEEDDIRAQGLLRTTLAWILLDSSEDPQRAVDLLGDAHRRLSDAGMEIELAYTETELSRASLALGDPPAAIDWARRSLERLGGGDRLESARARLALAWALMAHGEQAAAVEELTVAAESLELLNAGRQAASAWRDLAELYQRVGDGPASLRAYARTVELLGLPPAPAGRGVPGVAEDRMRAEPEATWPTG